MASTDPPSMSIDALPPPVMALACVEAVNHPEAFAAGRALIGRNRLPIPEKLADPAVPLRDAFA